MAVYKREEVEGRDFKNIVHDLERERFEHQKRTSEKHTAKVTFADVCEIMAFSNVCSYIEEDVEAFLEERGLKDIPRIFMADHSMGVREWKIAEGRTPAYFEESCFNGGWYVFVEEDVTYLFGQSATSGSSLTAERIGRLWSVTLEVPVKDGTPYRGSYWKAFHSFVNPQ